MKKGTVKFYNNQKGFGFIKEDGTGTEIFVHSTGLQDTVRENDAVVFEVTEGKKCPNAVNVKLA
jgi:CspA family cold shock protein